MDSQDIITELRALREQQTANHIEVVQRLTAVETQIAPMHPLEERVRKLEGWRSKIAGGLIVTNAIGMAVTAWVSKRFLHP